MHHRGVSRCTRLTDDGDESDGHENTNKDGESINGITRGAQRSHTVAGRSIFSSTRLAFDTDCSESDNSDKDEDEYESEDCVVAEESPQAASQQSKPPQEPSQPPSSSTSTNTTSDCWKGKREELIGMLKDSSSDIHLISGKNKTDKCRNIRNRYANEFEEKKVVDALLRLLRQKEKKEGPFAENNEESDDKPLWKNRSKISQGYSLLYKLRLHSCPPEKFSAEEIYKHHKIFHQYDLGDFKHYDKNMIELTNKHRAQCKSEVERWERHRLACSDRNVSSRGKHIWYKHPARDQLIEDTRSGKARQMKPKDLHQTNVAYQDFSLDDFRKHVYQDKYSQLAGPYWQKKRNKIARKEHEKAVDNLYKEWQDEKFADDMDGLVKGVEAL